MTGFNGSDLFTQQTGTINEQSPTPDTPCVYTR